MTPQQMTNEELAEVLENTTSLLTPNMSRGLFEAANRLRATTPRTSPPTVEEVGDIDWCLAYDGDDWDSWEGLTVRMCWHGKSHGTFTHWIPIPAEPKGGK